MGTFSSVNYCTTEASGFEGLYKHDRGSERVIVKDTLIGNDIIATARAKAELLKGGYIERWVDITTVHVAGLKQNDIISFKGLNWIVKEISLDFKSPTLIQNIKGLRYE